MNVGTLLLTSAIVGAAYLVVTTPESLKGVFETIDYFKAQGSSDPVDVQTVKAYDLGTQALSYGYTVRGALYEGVVNVGEYVGSGILDSLESMKTLGNIIREVCVPNPRFCQVVLPIFERVRGWF